MMLPVLFRIVTIIEHFVCCKISHNHKVDKQFKYFCEINCICRLNRAFSQALDTKVHLQELEPKNNNKKTNTKKNPFWEE